MKQIFYGILALSLAVFSGQTAHAHNQSGGKTIVSAETRAAFTRWRDGFRERSAAAGIKHTTFDAAFKGVGFNPEIVRRDGSQAETTRAIWQYLDTAVSSQRIGFGRDKRRDWQAELTAIEARYGVEASILLAIWGLETAYGEVMGGFNVFEALATLAYEGRRRKFAENQLIAALKIVEQGDKSPAQMTGSWAGAMGHTQFIPTSFQAYAVDFTGDGTRDVWFPPDALASTANFLRGEGWTKGQPWGLEVRLPSGFDYGLADQKNRKPVSFWRARGVRLIGGGDIPDHGEAAILTPAGASGPAFVIFRNFSVIRRYNNSTSYALAIGQLGDRIYRKPGITAPWPRGDKPLSRSQKEELQRRLTALGHSTGGIDGKIGPKTIRAIRSFQRTLGLIPDGYATEALLKRLR